MKQMEELKYKSDEVGDFRLMVAFHADEIWQNHIISRAIDNMESPDVHAEEVSLVVEDGEYTLSAPCEKSTIQALAMVIVTSCDIWTSDTMNEREMFAYILESSGLSRDEMDAVIPEDYTSPTPNDDDEPFDDYR